MRRWAGKTKRGRQEGEEGSEMTGELVNWHENRNQISEKIHVGRMQDRG